MAEVEIRTERIDDIPLLFHQQQRMGIPGIIDEVIAVHGNRQGLNLGPMLSVWIGYILSEADGVWSVTISSSRLGVPSPPLRFACSPPVRFEKAARVRRSWTPKGTCAASFMAAARATSPSA